MFKYKLIISIVPHNCGEIITNASVQAGANGGTILMGRGTAQNSILQLLGLGETSKDIAYILAAAEDTQKIINKIKETTNSKKTHFGIIFTIEVNSFMKSGTNKAENNLKTQFEENPTIAQNNGGEKMAEKSNSTYEMINVIVNKGYAEDAMDAARKAGAGGGTIINARGTAKQGDATFFGVEIIPEKEMLFILTPKEKKEAICKAISSLECFRKTGSGIIFCNQANDFDFLGRANN